MGIFDKFKSGLGKSSSSLTDGFKNIFSKKKVDSTILEEFEELIISSDAGVDVAKELRKDFESLKVDKKLDDHKEILKLLACLLYTSPSPRDIGPSRMPSSA